MSNPIVSCIIPTCNRPNVVANAINSVLTQTYKVNDIIVVDDSSNDLTEQYLKKCNFPIKYIKNSTRKGAQYSRNVGIYEAKGDFITFLDDDDLWNADKICRQLKFIEKFPIVSCSYISLGTKKQYKIRLPKHISYKKILVKNYIGSCSFVMTDAKLQKNCYFDKDLKAAQDWDMWISLMKKNNIKEVVAVPEYLVLYNNSNVIDRIANRNMNERLSSIIRIYTKNIEDYDINLQNTFFMNNFINMNNFSWINKELFEYLTLSASGVTLMERIKRKVLSVLGILKV
jgi:glycosyltransferase involved in cell wall biosynthesis